jgi:hypothetical protein
MFHTSGLKGVVQYVFKRIQQKHIPLTNFVVFANVTLLYSEEENVIFSLGRFRMNWSKLLMTIGRSVYSKQFQVTNSKYKQQSSTYFNTCM